MFIVKRVRHVQEWVAAQKKESRHVGFVPTMGALHSGHISLVELSRRHADVTIVSIFVNPRQFNDPEDLKKYPRPIEEDLRLLHSAGADAVFLPEVEDIFPEGESHEIEFDPGPAAMTMEGKFRPGHFKGMAEVVYRLLEITSPDKLFMGQKDFQQFSIIRKLIQDFHLPIDLVMCPTIREPHGLAMSSRNVRLSPMAREKAGVIYQSLVDGKNSFEARMSIDAIQEKAVQTLKAAGVEPEYFEIVDGYTLMPLSSYDPSTHVVACCAVKVEGVRLIDNMIWRGE